MASLSHPASPSKALQLRDSAPRLPPESSQALRHRLTSFQAQLLWSRRPTTLERPRSNSTPSPMPWVETPLQRWTGSAGEGGEGRWLGGQPRRQPEDTLQGQVPPTPCPSHAGGDGGSRLSPWSSSRVSRSNSSSPQTVAQRGSWDPLLACIPPTASRRLLIGCGELRPSPPALRREPSGSKVGGAHAGSGSPSRVPVPCGRAEAGLQAGRCGRSRGDHGQGWKQVLQGERLCCSSCCLRRCHQRAGVQRGPAGRRGDGERGARSWSTHTPTSQPTARCPGPPAAWASCP